MTPAHTMPDSRTRSLGVSCGARCLGGQFSGLFWAAAVAVLLLTTSGCTSSLTAIALRDAMREIAEYGRRGDAVAEEADEEQLVEEMDAAELMSLEEALDSAVTRLAAVGRLDAEARQMLLETLEATSQEDWPIVIESFATSLEELAKSDDALEQVAETLDAEAGETMLSGELPTEELVAAVDLEEVAEPLVGEEAERVAMSGEPAVAADGGQEIPATREDLGVATAAADSKPSLAADSTVATVAVETPAAEELEAAAADTTLPAVEEPPLLAANGVSDEQPASPVEATDDAQVAREAAATEDIARTESTTVPSKPSATDALPGLLAERVTTAIREMPVSEASSLSPEETMQRLEEALAIARRQAPLRVDNPCFAWQVRAWGDVERCDVSRFHVGQQVIVYFEVDNLTSDVGPEGHATKLDTELRLVNVSGECLHEWSFPPLAESCPAPRRDYFARYILEVPEGIAPGPLRLEMTVNDLLGEKSTAVALPLEVIGQPDLPGERVASDATLLR